MNEIIKKYGIKAKKSLGQNFLVDENILDKISDVTNVSGENIVEVGPGYGALTGKLLEKKPKSLTLIELDKFMVDILNDRVNNKELDTENVDFHINNIDVLKFVPEFKNYKIIANIPYYITSPILHRFLYDIENKPTEMIILMQKDVGDRIISKKSSVLSLFVQKKCTVFEKILVSNTCFSPPPKVQSSVLQFIIHDLYNDINDGEFLSFIKLAFSNPRKKMINNLGNGGYNKEKIDLVFNENGLTQNTRAEELDLLKFITIFKNLA